MCACKPTVRTPCCGSPTCHAVAKTARGTCPWCSSSHVSVDERVHQISVQLEALQTELRAIEKQAYQESPEAVLGGPGPVLRPHSIPGWWQVWSGEICICLLRPEDVAPVRAHRGDRS